MTWQWVNDITTWHNDSWLCGWCWKQKGENLGGKCGEKGAVAFIKTVFVIRWVVEGVGATLYLDIHNTFMTLGC